MILPSSLSIWFFHGLGDWSNSWSHAHGRHELRDAQIFTPDFPGCGRRPSTDERLEELAQRFISEIEESGVHRAVLVGHSLGGVLAALIAEQKPQWLAGIVDIEGTIAIDERVVSKRIVETKNFDTWFRGFCDSIYRQGLDRPEMRSYHAGLLMCDQPTMIRQAEDLVRLRADYDMGHRFGRLSVPRLFCYGDQAQSDTADELMAKYDFDRHLFKGAGHWLMSEQPDEFYRVLADWIARII